MSASRKVPDWTLRSLIETAINCEADEIELEYVPEGFEVTYFRGDTGVGEVINDPESSEAILSELIERAKLKNKSRGTFKWNYAGTEHEIRVKEYESFGESAFRLYLKKPKRRA
jgi:hypothetical protein